jgi:FMN reductase
MNLVALGGSLREHSLSAAALRASVEIGASLGAHTQLLDLRLLDLPAYIPDVPIQAYPLACQARLLHFAQAVRDADVMLWATPTYHGSMSGAFKNAIDYIQMLAQEPTPYLQGKAVGLIAIGDSSPFTSMTACVHELRAWLAPTRVMLKSDDFSMDLKLSADSAVRRTTRLINELVHFNLMQFDSGLAKNL